MCGIAGIYDRTGNVGGSALENTAGQMSDGLRHRGPDGDGVWVDAHAGIALSHRRLAVLAPTPEGRQPMVSRNGRVVLTFNGEVYNFRALAQQLATEGHRVETNSDTVVLAEAISVWGVRETIGRLVGMFAFAVFDRQSRTLTLVRDRLGIKPLYWAEEAGCVLFASEISPIVASGLVDTERDPAAMADYFRHACIPAPRTIYRRVRKLMPGTLIEIPADGEPRSETYWDVAAIARNGQDNPLPAGDPAVWRETERLLEAAVADRLIADVPLGGWLSGGIDSSCVVALMQAASSTPVRSFSIGFEAQGYDESEHAAAIARHLGTDHTSLKVTAETAMAAVARMPSVYGEPFADSSQIPTYVLSELTREHVTVALSGDGGDEVFAGYNRYNVLPRIGARHRGLRPVRLAASAMLRFLSPGAWDLLAAAVPMRLPPQFGDKMWKAADTFDAGTLDEAYLAAISQWRGSGPSVYADNSHPEHAVLDATLSDPIARLQLADTSTYLPDDILTKVDRASMFHALEVRVPLLDHRVVEHAWRLPRRELLRGGTTKTPLRRALAKHVPRELTERPKSGFAIPIGDWLRGPLRDWAENLLDETELARSGMLDPRPVRTAWDMHLSGRRNLQNPLWTVLMFQLWDRDSIA